MDLLGLLLDLLTLPWRLGKAVVRRRERGSDTPADVDPDAGERRESS
jgi:hypothetical protein